LKPVRNLINKENGIVKFNEFRLENGLSVILSEDHSIPSAAINLCYHVGSKDEEPGKTGFAHLFEHLMFEGSANLPKGDYESVTANAGGENNAYTTEDKTNYYLLLPSHQLELGLWLESDRMLGCVVNETSLETQKKVVIEEKKQNFDNRPYGSVSIEFAPRLFPGSGYAWDTIGNVDDIKNAKLEDVKSFFKKYYTPNNAVLSVTGSFKSEEALKLIEKYFSTIEPGEKIKRVKTGLNNSYREIKEKIKDKIQFPGIFSGYRIPQENSKEFYVFDLLTEILAGGDSSRLYKNLVYEKQLAGEVGCWVDGKEYVSVLHLYVILLPGAEISETENEINNIFENIRSSGIEDWELQKAKNRIETKSYFRKQYLLSKADLLAHYKTFYNNPGLINTNQAEYLSVTKEDISEYSKKYLSKNNRVELLYIPDEVIQ
jgi:zinc protease